MKEEGVANFVKDLGLQVMVTYHACAYAIFIISFYFYFVLVNTGVILVCNFRNRDL